MQNRLLKEEELALFDKSFFEWAKYNALRDDLSMEEKEMWKQCMLYENHLASQQCAICENKVNWHVWNMLVVGWRRYALCDDCGQKKIDDIIWKYSCDSCWGEHLWGHYCSSCWGDTIKIPTIHAKIWCKLFVLTENIPSCFYF